MKTSEYVQIALVIIIKMNGISFKHALFRMIENKCILVIYGPFDYFLILRGENGDRSFYGQNEFLAI